MHIKRDVFQILEKYPEIKFVCFDFFDTLVRRTVEPEHTKVLASNQLSYLIKNGITGQKIYQWRQNMESELCRRNAENGKDSEFQITELASAVYNMLKHRFFGRPAFLTEEAFIDVFVKIEMNIETSVQRVFIDTKELLMALHGKDFSIAIVSDFYIPYLYYKHFLDHHGFSNHIDHVFISSDFGATKASGTLYEKIIATLDCKTDNLMMIGDNNHSDVQMAEAKGIKSYYVNRYRQKEFYEKWTVKQQLRKLKKNRLEKNVYAIIKQEAGELFPEMSLTLWRFTYLLFKQLIHNGIQNIFFFSKEGEFLKTLFDQFQMEQFGTCIIDSHYLIVSRKSTFICSLKPLMEEDFARLFYQYRSIAPREFLLSLNFNEREIDILCKQISVDFDKRIENYGFSDAYVQIIQNSLFAELYESKRRRQKKNFLQYLNSFGIDVENKGLYIVDVGWKGSIQDNIFFSFDNKIKVTGYYIGLLNPTNLSKLNHKIGILFSNNPIETPFYEVYNSNRSSFEMLLTATHGSADGYFTEEEFSNDYNETPQDNLECFTKKDGICIRTLDLPDERKLFTERIQSIQKQILNTCKTINQITAVTDAPMPDTEWYANQHARMMYFPTKHEISFFESLYHLENFGLFEYTEFTTDNALSIWERIKNFYKVVKKPETVLSTGIWAPIVLKRLGLKGYSKRFGKKCFRRIFSNTNFFSKTEVKKTIKRGLHRLKPKKLIKIVFFLGIPEICGGTYVIFEHAYKLKLKGYQVFILTQDKIDPSRYAWHPDADKLEWLTFNDAGGIKFDFAIATWWRSALLLGLVKADTYIYFIQSIETRFFPEDENATYDEMISRRLAQKTYLLPLPVITEADWIQQYLSENYHHHAKIVKNGIRKDIYKEQGDCHAERELGRLRVLVEGQLNIQYKNVERAVELSRRSDADEVWLLTSSKINTYPGVDRVFSQIPSCETPPIYRSCDVLVKLSYIEGMFGPPLEMFHCGGTAIVYNVTGHDEYIRHDVNSFVVQADDENSVVKYLNRLKHQPEVLERLKCGARDTAKQWPDWNTSSRNFENVLRRFYGELQSNQAYLNRVTDTFFRHAQDDINSINILMSYKDDRSTHQRFQIFWHYGKGFNESQSRKFDYESGKWITIKTRLSLSSGEIYLRIDPCIQIGVILIKHILIHDTNENHSTFKYDANSQWKGVEVCGTASVIDDKSVLMIEATGQDPQIILPSSETNGADIEIDIEVLLKLMPFPLKVGDLIQLMGKRKKIV